MTRPPLAIVPAAGFGRRLAGDQAESTSKEVLRVRPIDGPATPAPAIHHLLRLLAAGGIEDAEVVLRPEKQDLIDALSDGVDGMRVRVRRTQPTASVPHTIEASLRAEPTRDIALGFPDILIAPADAFARLRAHWNEHDCDVVLGLFPTTQVWKTDMVEVDAAGRPTRIVIKPESSPLTWTWSIAQWRSRFSRFLLEWLETRAVADREQSVGDVFNAALERGISFGAVAFEAGRYLDIGTPEDLARVRA